MPPVRQGPQGAPVSPGTCLPPLRLHVGDPRARPLLCQSAVPLLVTSISLLLSAHQCGPVISLMLQNIYIHLLPSYARGRPLGLA